MDSKTHFKILGVDARKSGQSEFEYTHQAACGYVRDIVTTDGDHVDCELCLSSKEMEHYHQINSCLTDSSGSPPLHTESNRYET